MMNTHDVSWGTRDPAGHAATNADVKLRRFSIAFASVWLLSNTALVAVEKMVLDDVVLFLRLLLRLGACIQAFQVLFALLHVLRSKLRHDCHALCWRCSGVYNEYYTVLGSSAREEADDSSGVRLARPVRHMALWLYCCIAWTRCGCLSAACHCMTCCKDGKKTRVEALRASIVVQQFTTPLMLSRTASASHQSDGALLRAEQGEGAEQQGALSEAMLPAPARQSHSVDRAVRHMSRV